MNKVWLLRPGEDWIVDRFVDEWNIDNADISVQRPSDADVIWLMADWCWNQVPRTFLTSRKVLVTVHHIVVEKFRDVDRVDFLTRDQYVTAYHVPNKYTYDFVRHYTGKPIHIVPYWANQKIWRPTGTKENIRKRHALPTTAHLIGSFQRDTEGHDLVSPKLEKGPDLLADAIIGFRDANPNKQVEVVLAGWRRQYVMKRLDEAGVRYHYFERPAQEVINDLYQTLDTYYVTARYEGGPQALIECGLLGVKVASRPMGIASQVLPPAAIDDNVLDAVPVVPAVTHLHLPDGYRPYRELIQSL